MSGKEKLCREARSVEIKQEAAHKLEIIAKH
jgi:hypothetical protein